MDATPPRAWARDAGQALGAVQLAVKAFISEAAQADVVPGRELPALAGGIEAPARAGRWQALSWAASHLAAAVGRRQALILTGHTADDQAETVLLGLARGAGAGAVGGMLPLVELYLPGPEPARPVQQVQPVQPSQPAQPTQPAPPPSVPPLSGAAVTAPLLVVALSGGPDSLAVAAAAAWVAQVAGPEGSALPLAAVIVDHGWRDSSAAEASKAAQMAWQLGISQVVVISLAAPQEAWLHGPATPQAATWGAAHARGVRVFSGKPLLGLRRAQTVAACAQAELVPLADPTNQPGALSTQAGTDLPRVAVRHRVLPALAAALGQDPVPGLARTATLARQDEAALTQQAAALLDQVLLLPEAALAVPDLRPESAKAASEIRMRITPLVTASPAVLRRALRTAALRAGVRGAELQSSHLQQIEALVTGWRGQGPVDLPGARAAREDGYLVFRGTEMSRIAHSGSLALGGAATS